MSTSIYFKNFRLKASLVSPSALGLTYNIHFIISTTLSADFRQVNSLALLNAASLSDARNTSLLINFSRASANPSISPGFTISPTPLTISEPPVAVVIIGSPYAKASTPSYAKALYI
jgi:hypothetical protein